MRGFHRAVSASDEARRLGGASRVNRAPILQRDAADERWLLDRDSHQDDGRGGGQSVEWSFDNLPHDLLLKAVRKHVKCKWALLYIERWLTAPMEKDGVLMERSRGTPQGGVISPIISNLFLHYTFDLWMTRVHPDLPWCRYADDGLDHMFA